MPSTEIKPGWKTTEFWITLVSGLAGIARLLGLIGPEDERELIDLLPPVIVATVPFIMYIWSRTKVKVAPPTASLSVDLGEFQDEVNRLTGDIE